MSITVDLETAFARTIVNAKTARIRLVPTRSEMHTADDILLLRNRAEADAQSISGDTLFLTEQGSFCDPVNGITLYLLAHRN